MRFFNEENFGQILEFAGEEKLTVEFQQKIHRFMHDEKVWPRVATISKQNMTIASDMLVTSNNPANIANWAKTLTDGSQMIWNRKARMFYHVGELVFSKYDSSDWDFFLLQEEEDSHDMLWLVKNFHSWRFRAVQKILVDIYDGNYKEYTMVNTLK